MRCDIAFSDSDELCNALVSLQSFLVENFSF